MLDIPIPAARVRQAIADCLSPLLSSMDAVRDGVWAQDLGDGLRGVVGIQARQGAGYVIAYGVCCGWVPVRHGSSGYVRPPRTIKQTTLHLWVDDHNKVDPVRQRVSALCDDATMRVMAERAAQEVATRAPTWWQHVRAPVDVLREARRQSAETFQLHWPEARVVAAFTLAHLGDLVAAEAELALTVEGRDPALVDRLRQLG